MAYDTERAPMDQGSLTMFSLLQTEFDKNSNEIKAQLDSLSAHLNNLGISPQDSHEMRDEMNNAMERLKEKLEGQKQLLISLEQATFSVSEQASIAQLGGDLQSQLTHFQYIQKKSKEKFHEFILKVQELQVAQEADEETSPLISLSPTQAQQQAIKEEISYNERLIKEREQGIKEIEAAMVDVREIFRDLGLLVSEQQLGIDHIEANLEAAVSRTRSAARELDRANEYRRSRAWTLWSFILAIIILLIILLVLLSL